MGIFDRYAPFVQDFIYSHAWESLRGIQVAAADAIFNTDENVLLTAQTASGKTEAAFFPILTDFWENPPASVGAIYIGPTKALINDQFYRLNDLCAEAEVPVWHWHGDVSASHKAKLLKKPSGILQITPESLEALLMHRHAAVNRLFCDLRFVVIDEVHSLLRGDRGGQALCLIQRLGRMAGVNPRRIGLSATIGDPEATGAYLSQGTGRSCVIPQVQEPPRTWRLSMEHFYITGPQADERPAAAPAASTLQAEVVSVENVENISAEKDTNEGLGPSAACGPYENASAEKGSQGGLGHIIACSDSPARTKMPETASSARAELACDDMPEPSGVKFSAAPSATETPSGAPGTLSERSSAAAGDAAPGISVAAKLFEHRAMCPEPTSEEPSEQDVARPDDEVATDVAPVNADPGMAYVFEHTRGHKCLVFCNSREEAEAVTTTLRSYCEANHEPDRFLIHHGNLSASYRESAEEIMRDESTAMTTVATATLELGIDVGRLERAFQIDAPFTVSGFLQRMGRTGRRGTPPEMRFVMREEQPEPRSLLPETIPWKLLQGIALVQLYREEKWVEPPQLDRLPYSLLYHQTLATLASEGELSPAQLALRVLTLTPFHRVTQDDFRVLLRHLLETDQIEQTEAGGLIVGLAGERVTNSYKFYAVFQENVEYTVRSDSQEVGTLVQPPPPGEKIAIAGRVWIVDEVDHTRHVLYATPVKGKVPAYFGECPGDINTRILERMRQVLDEQCGYPYLMRHARARLAQARFSAAQAGLTRTPLINLGGNMWCLLPWLGSYAFLALERLLKIKCAPELGLKGLDSSRPYFMTFIMAPEVTAERFYAVVKKHAAENFDPLELVYPGEIPYFDKYDELLPEELVRKGFAEGVLDIAGMRERVLGWGASALPA